MTRPYATSIAVTETIRLDLFSPTIFRVRTSELRPEPFPDRYEIPFAVGHTDPWDPVDYELDRREIVAVVTTAELEIHVPYRENMLTVWTAGHGRRVYPSDGPIRGIFRDGYACFDGASANGEYNLNSRFCRWFYSPDTGRYTDVYLDTDLLYDRYFVYGPDYGALFAGYNELVGPEPLLPRKAYGFFQTQHIAGHGSQTRLMELASALRARHIPCDALILDFEWGDGHDENGPIPWGHSLEWSGRYTTPLSPKEMIARLDDEHFKLMLIHHSVPDYPDRSLAGWANGPTEPARWWRALDEKLADGVAGSWQDTRQNDHTDSLVYTELEKRTGKRVYFMGCRQMFRTRGWDGAAKFVAENNPTGSRRYPFDWTGDCDSTWEELAWQIRAIVGNQGSMKAVTYLTNDGYGRDWKIQARWNQFISFNSVARSHNQKPWETSQDADEWLADIAWDGAEGTTNTMREVERIDAATGPTAEASIRRHLQTRYRLFPYIYSVAHENYRTGMPICRPLLLAFPHDPRCNNDQWPTEYLFGDSILVAPVTAEIDSMQIYLPDGSDWIEWWGERIDASTSAGPGCGRTFRGGNTIEYDTSDVGYLPLFVRAGAVIPMLANNVQWLDDVEDVPYEIRLYPGTSSRITLFEDDGVSLAYRRGDVRATTIEHEMTETGRRCVVDPGAATYEGAPSHRKLRFVFVGCGAPGSVTAPDGAAWDVDAATRRVSVEFEWDTSARIAVGLESAQR